MPWAGAIVLAAMVAERLAELAVAQRNTARLRARGASEFGRRHYPLFVILHTAWLATIAWLVANGAQPDWRILAIFALLLPARLWIMASLGPRWTTRILTLPGAARVTTGPYRLCRHPNYVVVALEIAVLPLAFGAWRIAGAFSLANAALTLWRIQVEDTALTRSP
jgi:methyltransferase